MRFSLLFLAIGVLTLSSCGKTAKVSSDSPPSSASKENVKPVSELAQTIAKYEMGMDEQLAGKSVLMDDMGPVRERVKLRASESEAERVATLESFIDQYVASMRKFIREQTIFENWEFKTTQLFPDTANVKGRDRVKKIENMEKFLGITPEPFDTLSDRLTRIDQTQLVQLQKQMAKHRSELSLLDRAKLCVVKTRDADGSFIRYGTLMGMTIEKRYSATGEFIENLGMYTSVLPERKLGNSFTYSDEVIRSLNDLKFTNIPQVLIADQYKIDPQDDTHIIHGDWHYTTIILNTDPNGASGQWVMELEKATVKKTAEDTVQVESSIKYSSRYSIEKIGTALITIKIKKGDFEISDVRIESLATSFPYEKLKLEVDPANGGITAVRIP
jgi:hypothetical protein